MSVASLGSFIIITHVTEPNSVTPAPPHQECGEDEDDLASSHIHHRVPPHPSLPAW